MNFIRYISTRRVLRIGYTAAFLIMLLLAFVAIYGQNSGNFVITVDEDTSLKGIAISDEEAFTSWQRRLSTAPLYNAREYTLDFIPVEKVVMTDGDYSQSRQPFLGYTFYVKNVGEGFYPVYYQIKITGYEGDINDVLRVLVIIDGKISDDGYTLKYDSYKLYQEEDRTPKDDYPASLKTSSKFFKDAEGGYIVARGSTDYLKPGVNQDGEQKKITILMWIEGEDPECVEGYDVFGSKIKLTMDLSVYSFGNEN